jgi:hypothetical protein
MLMNLSAPDQRRASKAYSALTSVAGSSSCNSLIQTRVAGLSLYSLSPEIGSLPINALAIALALQAGACDPN